MTVLTETCSSRFHGGGGVGPFTWAWRFLANSDIKVYRILNPNEADTSKETLTLLMEGADYTLTGAGSYQGGAVALTTVLAVGSDLLVQRKTKSTQEVSIRNQGNNFRPEVHEDVFDQLTMMVQDRVRETASNTGDIGGLKSRMATAENRITEAEGDIADLQTADLGLAARMAEMGVGLITNPWVDARNYATLALADAAASASGLLLVISTQWNVVPAVLYANILVLPGGTINNGGALTINGAFQAGLYQVFIGGGAITFNGNSVIHAEWGTLQGMASASGGKELHVNTVLNVTNNLWTASVGDQTIDVVVHRGGGFNVSAGKTLTLPPIIRAGTGQIFFGNIAGIAGLSEVRPEWVGAKRDGVTDDGPAINLALQISTSAVILTKGSGMYAANNIVLKSGKRLIGNKAARPIITALATSTDLVTIDAGIVQDVAILDVNFRGYFDGGGANSVAGQNCFKFISSIPAASSGLWNSSFERIKIYGFTGNAIHLKGGGGNWANPIQWLSFRDVIALKAATANHALLMEGQVQHVHFDTCTFKGLYDVYVGECIHIDGTPDINAVNLVDVVKFTNCTMEMSDTAIVINTADNIVFDTCWIERLHHGITVTGASRGIVAIGTRFANCAWGIGPAAGWAVSVPNAGGPDVLLLGNVGSGENGLGIYANGASAVNGLVSIHNSGFEKDESAIVIGRYGAGLGVKMPLSDFASNAAAVAAGLGVGRMYRVTGTGQVQVVY